MCWENKPAFGGNFVWEQKGKEDFYSGNGKVLFFGRLAAARSNFHNKGELTVASIKNVLFIARGTWDSFEQSLDLKTDPDNFLF